MKTIASYISSTGYLPVMPIWVPKSKLEPMSKALSMVRTLAAMVLVAL